MFLNSIHSATLLPEYCSLVQHNKTVFAIITVNKKIQYYFTLIKLPHKYSHIPQIIIIPVIFIHIEEN